MASLLTTRMGNKWPLWTKIRTDPSSLGYRLLSVWADYFDWAYADTKRIADDTKLLKRGLGIGYLYQIDLIEEDLISNTVSNAGEQVFTFPSSVVADTFPVARVDNIDELCWSPLTRLVQTDIVGADFLTVYTDLRTGTPVIRVIDYPAHLLIQIVNSLDYFHRTPLRNNRATGRHQIVITGRDINGTRIVEHLPIVDDGYYWTRNVFIEIEKIVPEGFDGDILASIGVAADFIIDPFRTCVVDDGNEGPLKLEIRVDDNIVAGVLRYYTDLAKQGESYRDGVVEIQPNDEDVWEQYLLDNVGDFFDPRDIAIHPNNTHLYALDGLGFVHVYQHGPSPFGPPTLEDTITKTSYIETQPLKHWALLEESMRFFTRFVRIRVPILGVSIQRIKPDTTVEYLQSDKTWDTPVHEFFGNPQTTGNELPRDSWTDFDFTVDFDDLGQWEFYTIVRTAIDITVSYTAVMVDGLTALASIDSGVFNPIALMFGPGDELIITTEDPGPDGEDFSHFILEERSDYYLADGINQVLYFREYYNSIQLVNTYIGSNRLPMPTGLDETNLHLGMSRIDGESLLNFQRRGILETREPAGPTQYEFIRSISRQVGEFDIPVLRIDLLLNGSGVPLAADPFVEVTSTRLRAYSDYTNGTLDVEVDFTDRADGYFLRDVEASLSASSFFSIEILDPDYEFKKSENLRFGNTDVHITSELLLPSVENKLTNDRVKTFYPNNAATFINEVNTLGAIAVSGDYFVDYPAGVVYSFDVQSAFCSYTYSDFPYTLFYQIVRCFAYLDEDKKYAFYNPLISDTTGEEEFTSLNSDGAGIANTVLAVHPLSWGL